MMSSTLRRPKTVFAFVNSFFAISQEMFFHAKLVRQNPRLNWTCRGWDEMPSALTTGQNELRKICLLPPQRNSDQLKKLLAHQKVPICPPNQYWNFPSHLAISSWFYSIPVHLILCISPINGHIIWSNRSKCKQKTRVRRRLMLRHLHSYGDDFLTLSSTLLLLLISLIRCFFTALQL